RQMAPRRNVRILADRAVVVHGRARIDHGAFANRRSGIDDGTCCEPGAGADAHARGYSGARGNRDDRLQAALASALEQRLAAAVRSDRERDAIDSVRGERWQAIGTTNDRQSLDGDSMPPRVVVEEADDVVKAGRPDDVEEDFRGAVRPCADDDGA